MFGFCWLFVKQNQQKKFQVWFCSLKKVGVKFQFHKYAALYLNLSEYLCCCNVLGHEQKLKDILNIISEVTIMFASKNNGHNKMNGK